MKNSIPFLIFSLLVALMFTGCKKYDEGPAISLRSVKSRLTNGDWELEKLTIDGIDSTLEYKEIDFNYTITASSGLGIKDYSYTQNYTYYGQLVEVTDGTIVFAADGDKITFQTYNVGYGYNYSAPIFSYDNYNYAYVEWDIKKLTNKEFWLETIVNGMPVSMMLKKVK